MVCKEADTVIEINAYLLQKYRRIFNNITHMSFFMKVKVGMHLY